MVIHVRAVVNTLSVALMVLIGLRYLWDEPLYLFIASGAFFFNAYLNYRSLRQSKFTNQGLFYLTVIWIGGGALMLAAVVGRIFRLI